MFNFISLLGWSPGGEEEILSKDEIIKLFDPSKLSKSPAMFDKVKLGYINSRYIKMLDDNILKDKAKVFFDKANIQIKDDNWLLNLVKLFKDRMSYVGEIVELYNNFFHHEFSLNEEELNVLKEFNSEEMLLTFEKLLSDLNDFTHDAINDAIKETGKITNTKGKPLFMSLRIATTGDMHGPSLPMTLELLGKDEVLNRIKLTIKLQRGGL